MRAVEIAEDRSLAVVHRGAPDPFDEAIALLAEGRIPSEALISSVTLEEAEEAFQALTAPGNLRTKVLLDPRRVT